MSSLQNSLAIVGGLILVCVVLYNLWTARQNAPRQAAPEPSAGIDPVLDAADLNRQSIQDSAYLDDANTERYAKLVKSMGKETQFLFISHNKIAMEMAEQLIGVTMQEQGVSRIVAVDMEAAVSMAEAV